MNPISIVIFLGIAILIISLAHWLVYFSAVRLFSIIKPSFKHALAGFLAFLGGSFFFASFLSHFWNNSLTSAFYFLSGFWLGFLTNLVLAAAAAWISVWLISISGAPISRAAVAWIFFILASVFSLYGSWNAFHPRIKELAVTIPGLPESWKGKKIVQLSDVHLGHINGPGFSRKIVSLVNSVRPDLVLITGDLFDGMDGSLDALTEPLKGIKTSQGVYFVTGNHETYLGTTEAFAALKKVGISILDDQVADVGGLKIIGISYPDRSSRKDIVNTLESLKDDYSGHPNILLYHSPVEIDRVKASGVNLELCGHTHEGQLFPFGLVTSLIYKGYDYGLYRKGDYTLYSTAGAGTWGPPMRTGNIPEIPVITLE